MSPNWPRFTFVHLVSTTGTDRSVSSPGSFLAITRRQTPCSPSTLPAKEMLQEESWPQT